MSITYEQDVKPGTSHALGICTFDKLSTDVLDVLNDNVYQCHLLIPT